MSTAPLHFTSRLQAYLQRVSVRDDAIQQALRVETAAMPNHSMQISPEQGQFLALLVKLLGAQRILEVGTFTGYSALCMAKALPDAGQLVCCDTSETWTAVARRYWALAGVDRRIILHLGPARETLSGLTPGFDMAFIDADKENYRHYYEACLALLRPGGLVLIDNVLWGGSVVDPEKRDLDTTAIRALNDFIYRDPRVEICMLPLGDGVTMARKLV